MSENKEVKFDDIEKGSVIYEIDRTAIKRMVVTSDRIATDSVDPKYPDATFETSYQILHHISDIKDAPVITPGPDIHERLINCGRRHYYWDILTAAEINKERYRMDHGKVKRFYFGIIELEEEND